MPISHKIIQIYTIIIFLMYTCPNKISRLNTLRGHRSSSRDHQMKTAVGVKQKVTRTYVSVFSYVVLATKFRFHCSFKKMPETIFGGHRGEF